MLMIASLLPALTDSITDWMQYASLEQAYADSSDYLTLSNYQYTDTQLVESLNGHPIVQDRIYAMYKELEQTADAQFVAAFPLPGSDQTILYTNDNYINRIHVLIHNSSTEAIQIYVPDSLEDSVLERIKTNIVPEHTENTMFDVVFYSKDMDIFSENMDLGTVHNPVIVRIQPPLMDFEKGMIDTSSPQNPIRIQDTKENRNTIVSMKPFHRFPCRNLSIKKYSHCPEASSKKLH